MTIGEYLNAWLKGSVRGSARDSTFDLTEASVEALREHLARRAGEIKILGGCYEDAGLVFTSEVGTLINPTNLRRRSFASLLKKARVPRVRFHDLRHTCATLLFAQSPPEGRPGASGALQQFHHT